MPEYGLIQSQEQKQIQTLAPQQLMSLDILMLPMLELQEKITEELTTNPVMEQEKPAGEDLAPNLAPKESEIDRIDANGEAMDTDQELNELMRLADSWQDYLPPLHSKNQYTSDDDEKRQHFLDSLIGEPSLQEQLMEQLRLSECDEKLGEIAELVIGSIGENGYLSSHPADLATASGSELKQVTEAIKIVQSFDPPGIGARDIKECLTLQLKRAGETNEDIYEIVNKHLEDVAKNRLPNVAKRLNISMHELYNYLDKLKNLNPYPGALISPNNPIYVIPEVVVDEKDGEFFIVSNDDYMPKLRISQHYIKMLEDPNESSETKSYIREKMSSVKSLMKSLSQRQKTITRIAEVLIDQQYDFLKNGVEYLHPMTMQQVADKLDLHETTISRAIANKYIECPMGLFEFKFFFSGGYSSDDGEVLSSRSVKEKLKDIIMSEDTAKPYSDKKLEALMKTEGIPVARRTIAKYREEMGIPSSNLRKEF